MIKTTLLYSRKTPIVCLIFWLLTTFSGFSQVLEVNENNVIIPDNSSTTTNYIDFGTVPNGNKSSKSFVIKNTGNLNLTFTGSKVALTNTTDFSITTNVVVSSNTLTPNTYLIIEISYNPSSTSGSQTSKVTITSNSKTLGSGSYTFNIKGTATTSVASNFTRTTLSPTFSYPYALIYGPDDYLWLTERGGKKINRVKKDGTAVDLLLDMTSSVYYGAIGAQDGLLGLALHPNLGKGTGEDYVYVAYTYGTNSTDESLRIVRYTYSITGTDGSLASPLVLIEGLSASNDHNSGKLAFGPDNKLYYTIGDQGVNQFANKCEVNHSQDIPTQAMLDVKNYNYYEGKTLRINLDGSIPADNPVINGVKSHIFTYGHRNAQGLVFGKNGKLYSSEHGPKSDDEINILKSGDNYGWPYISGYKDDKNYEFCNWSTATNCSSLSFSDYVCGTGATSLTESSWAGTFTPPITTLFTIDAGYNFTGGWLTWPTIGPSSAKIYEGFNSQIPGWDNSIFMTTLKKGRVYRQKLSADGNSTVGNPEELFYTQNRYRDIAFDPDGKTIYIITDSGGTTSGPSGSSSLTVTDFGKILKFTYNPALVACVAPTPDVTTLPTITDQCSVTSITAPTATNSCSGAIVGTTTTVFPITTQGTTTVVWTYKYGNGNSLTQNQTVIIDDTVAPVTPTLTNVTAQCSATPSAPTTTDVCAGTITGTTTTTFPITTQGTTVVTWTFNDGNGQSITADQNVIIDDTVAPLTPALADLTGQCEVTPAAPTTTDACAGTITGTTTTTFPITAPGTTVVTWNFNDGNGQSINVNQNVIIETTTWNGATWSNGTPNATKHLIVTGNYTPVADVTACSLTVNNNAVVLVNSGINFNIAGDVTVATGSSLTFENNANLIQTKNTNGNTGNITVKRKTTPLMLLDYVIWSAPVAEQQLQSFSPATLAARFLTYNPTTNQYNAVPTPSAVNFSTGTGYLIRMPNNHPTTPTIWEGQFQGIPNNGNYNLTVANDTYNAIGNPYPSTLNANTFIAVNNITEALYFWRKTNNAATTSYATYTTAGGTSNAGGLSLAVPNGTIQVGQGFIAKSTSTTIAFTNAMRSANNGNQFFKSKEIERNRIWLNLSKGTVSVNQMMIAYMTGATAGIDTAIDGKYFNDNKIALTSNLNNEEYVIQGRGLPFDTADTVALAFKTNATGIFTIAIDAVDGLFANSQDIFLKDKTTNTLHDLKKLAYTFTSEAGTFNDRFEIVFKSTASLGVETPESIANAIVVYKQNGTLHIEAGKTILKNVRLYDVRGRQLYEQKNLNTTTTSIKDFATAKQTVLVQITTNENKVITKKVLY
jgi:PQQ-dependent dehydrogenase (s-GDH family)